ncbi:MAG: DUF1223 domain-containing protein [Bryobacteraceae bacterium]
MRAAVLILGSLLVTSVSVPSPIRRPVLVELFTSEGCSSCPPADALLQKLDQSQPVPEAEVIVLSEHVDYWNDLGWSDPYSSAQFSRRQEAYSLRFRTSGPYTPQMVVDGGAEFVGSDWPKAMSTIAAAAKEEKLGVRLVRSGNGLRVEIDPARHGGEVFLALAENNAASQVARGENQGRKLTHVAVVRRLEALGKWNGRSAFTREIPVPPGDEALRVIAFVQEPGNGRILGAALLPSQP